MPGATFLTFHFGTSLKMHINRTIHYLLIPQPAQNKAGNMAQEQEEERNPSQFYKGMKGDA